MFFFSFSILYPIFFCILLHIFYSLSAFVLFFFIIIFCSFGNFAKIRKKKNGRNMDTWATQKHSVFLNSTHGLLCIKKNPCTYKTEICIKPFKSILKVFSIKKNVMNMDPISESVNEPQGWVHILWFFHIYQFFCACCYMLKTNKQKKKHILKNCMFYRELPQFCEVKNM